MTRPVRPQFDDQTLLGLLHPEAEHGERTTSAAQAERTGRPASAEPPAAVFPPAASSPPTPHRPREARREPNFVLARFEKRALPWLAARLPARVTPDHLTLLGVCAALGIAAAYVLSNEDRAWLWAVNVLLVVHWFGDSLDGTLARVRKIERPRYGYYLDHLTDAFSTFVIGMGLGLSPYMLIATGLAIVIAYLALSINVYLETHVFDVFKLGYSWVGPTEARAALFVVNALLAAGLGLDFRLQGIGLTLLDVVGVLAASTMAALLALRVVENLRVLGREEPAGRRGEPDAR